MRQTLITFAASALGALAALAGWRYLVPPEVPPEPVVTAFTPADDGGMRRPGEALDDRMVREERAIEAIRSDLIAIAAARTAVTEYYLSTGRMPATNAEAGLAVAADYRGRSLRSLSIGEAGRLVLAFDALSGRDGGVIEFVPDLGGVQAMGVQWRCRTRDYPQIVRAVPSCDYDDPQALPASFTDPSHDSRRSAD